MDNTQSQQKNRIAGITGSSTIIIAALMIGYSLIYMDKSMIPLAIIPIGEEFSLDASQTGIILSAFFLGYSLLQIPGGWLADKFGAKRVLIISLAIIAVFSIAFGLGNSLIVFAIIRCLTGFGHAGYPPSCSKSIAENFPQEKRTFVQSLVLSTSGIGGILAYMFGARLISIDWKFAYFVLGVLFIIAALCVFMFLPNKTNEVKNEKATTNKVSLAKVISDKRVLILFFSMLLLNFLLYGVMSWMPSFLKTKFSLEISTVSTILTVNALLQTVATLSVGRLLSGSFVGKERQFLLVTTGLSAVGVCGLAFIDNLPVAVVCLYLVSMISVSAFIGIFTWPHKILNKEVIGSSIGIINTGGTIGGFLAPMILGAIITNTGGDFTLALLSMAVASVLAGLCGLFVKNYKG